MNTDKRLIINHLKCRRVNHLKELYENFGEEEERRMRKTHCIEKLTPFC